MEFSVSSAELLIHLNKANAPIGNNMSNSMMENFLFELEQSELTVTGTDGDVTIKSTLNVESSDIGNFCVPAKILVELLKSMSGQPVQFSLTEDQFNVELSSVYGKYSISGQDPKDFPMEQVQSDMESIELDGNILTRGFSKTQFAISTDDLRKSMTGLFFQIDFSKLVMVSTDSHKLVKYEYRGIDSDVTTSFVIPRKPLSMLKGMFEEESKVIIEYNDKRAYFTYGDTVLSCALMDTKFPDYRAVLPTDEPKLLKVRRADLLSSLKRLSLFANKATYQVVLDITENSLTLQAQDFDYANKATEQLPCEYESDDLTIGFNGKFLVEILNNFDVEYVIFKLYDYNRSSVIVPDENEDNEDLLMLIMPILI